ncbi:MAG TPA: SCO family protein [Usitatibacter sp.]|nr:SCO family protein [Usitatibacter sp.]
MRRRAALAAALAVGMLGAGGCDKLFAPAKSPFKGIDITGSAIGGELRLNDHDGKPRALADFRGKVVVVFFGYTHCPDVCPTTLADLSGAMKRLGAEAARVQVLLVTVDPKRDTPELLKQYVTAFDPSFIGLRGDTEALTRVTKDFHVYWNVREGRTPQSYTVDHAGQAFALDREGKARLMFAPGIAPEAIASDLRLLLNS